MPNFSNFPRVGNGVTIIDGATLKEVNLNAAIEKLAKKAEEQAAQLLERADGTYEVKTEFQAQYLKEKDKIEKFILENMAASLSTSLLTELVENAYMEFGKDVTSKFKNAADVGGWFGEFIELEFLGLVKDTKQTADITEINTEVKAHTGENPKLGVGLKMTRNIPTLEMARSKALTDAVILFKMAEKMQNLLLFEAHKEMIGDKLKIKFSEINLFMTLILKELYNMIYNRMRNESVLMFDSAVKWNPKDMKASFDVKLKLNRIQGVYEFARLYLYQKDLLKEIKSDDSFRRAFFAGIQNMKFTNFGGEGAHFTFPITRT